MTVKPGRYPAQAMFFPAAICHALVVIPLSVLANTGAGIVLPGLIGSGHAQEMLSGFALALVAGYTLGPTSRATAMLLLGIWLVGRVATLWGMQPLDTLATLLFGILLAKQVVPRYLPARRWRNQAQMPLLGAVSLLPGLWGLTRAVATAQINVAAETMGILLLTLLMLFMGGRLIAPAAAGDFHDRGGNLENRVQPRIEGALLIVVPAAISLFVLGAMPAAGMVLILAGALAAIRLWRWRLWRCRGRTDLHGLGVGYGWLATGLLVAGASMVAGQFRPALLHVVTIGALGTLSTGVMARWFYHQDGRRLPSRLYVIVTAGAMAVATLARIGAVYLNGMTSPMLWASLAGWELAYTATLLVALSYLYRRSFGRPGHASGAVRHD